MGLNLCELPAPENSENETWQFGYKKYGGAVVRYVSSEAVDPTVLIEKFADQNPWFRQLVTGVGSEQYHFGLGYLEEGDYTPDPRTTRFMESQQAMGALALHQGIALIEYRVKVPALDASKETPHTNQDRNQLTLF